MQAIFKAKARGFQFSVFEVSDEEYIVNVAKGENVSLHRVISDKGTAVAVATTFAEAFGMTIESDEE